MNQPKILIKKPFKNLSRWSKPSQINYNKLSLNQMNDPLKSVFTFILHEKLKGEQIIILILK
jgi:hypothetical protein